MAGVDGLLERVGVERRAIAHGTVIGNSDGPRVASDGEEQEGERARQPDEREGAARRGVRAILISSRITHSGGVPAFTSSRV